ncbi:hypothetical protein SCLCIDRAFT_1213390 [Scleroderma citrinum Foug A]|uniref:MARVEL domain-containing protein n=1 Tax=Scleroderma citrinum Foug A TaxID=1036808 RepID=A0A0C2ZRX6_9AGAM|nr:hypothetical protein SCLCIDRAFT_1213390 [Scleroderma citrinum Foug A]
MQALTPEAEFHIFPPPPLTAKAISAAATASVVIASMSMPSSRQHSISLVEMLPFASSLCILAALATGSFALQSNPAIASAPDVSKSRMYSSAISSIIAAVTPMLALIYFCPLYLLYRHSKRNPRPLNKTSGMKMQQYGPLVYVFLLFSSLAGVADATWLLLQYKFNNNAPNPMLRSGVRFLLFAGCWTTITSGTYTLFFLDPIWSRRPIASVGTQAVWVLVTWVFWVAGTSLLDKSSPVFTTYSCEGVVYCGQLKALLALSVIQILTLTFGMCVIGWLVWQSARSIRQPMVIRLPYGGGR